MKDQAAGSAEKRGKEGISAERDGGEGGKLAKRGKSAVQTVGGRCCSGLLDPNWKVSHRVFPPLYCGDKGDEYRAKKKAQRI